MKTSVAMATRNGGPWIDQQLQSIAQQTHPPVELVICDDGSTDNTPDAVSRFTQTAPFPVRFSVNPQRLGPAQNFARAIELCTGDIIALADQDDHWHTDKLQRLHDRFMSDDAVALVFSDLRLIDVASKPLGKTQWQTLGFTPRQRQAFSRGKGFDQLLRYNVVNGAALAFRASSRNAALPIPAHWMHDEWIALILSALAPIALIDDTLQAYRVHAEQQVGPAVQGIRSQLRYARRYMNEKYFVQMLERTRAAHDRLKSIGNQVKTPHALDALERRAEHYQTRVNMRRPRAFRSPMIIQELFHGRYHRFGYGWKSALQDLVLR